MEATTPHTHEVSSVDFPANGSVPTAGEQRSPDPSRRPRARRLGGTPWSPTSELPTGQITTEPLELAPVRQRRRKQRRRWYRRPALVVPLVLLLLLTGSAGHLLLRLEGTVHEMRTLSSPPPLVVASDEEGQPEVEIDTAPAREYLTAQGADTSSDAGLFDRFQDGAVNVTDLAGGAAAAAGVTEGSQEAVNILLMGVDARPGAPIDVGVKADTLIVVRLDPAAGTCRTLSIPRDTRTELPGYGQSKINHALLVGGIPYQQLVVEHLLGIELDHYVLVDFAAFQQVVDLIGGVPVTVPEDLMAEDGSVRFAAGTHVMDGAEALAYVRYRATPEGDVGRVQRQLDVLRGLAQTMEGRDLVTELNTVLPAVADHVRSDLSVADMTGLARGLQGRCTSASAETSVLTGTRVQMHDPILRYPVYFNVVNATTIEERVRMLLAA